MERALRVDNEKHILRGQQVAHAERGQEELVLLRGAVHIRQQAKVEVLMQASAEFFLQVVRGARHVTRRRRRRTLRISSAVPSVKRNTRVVKSCDICGDLVSSASDFCSLCCSGASLNSPLPSNTAPV